MPDKRLKKSTLKPNDMDYKYIEQLLERYFAGETSLHEEQILHAFFAQDEQELPATLRQWIPLFAAMQPEDALGEDFDERMLALTEETVTVKARTIKLGDRMRPLLRAAAIVAVVLTLTDVIDMSMKRSMPQDDEIDYAAYKDTYEDPAMAYDKVEDALRLLSEGFSTVQQQADTLQQDSLYKYF